MDFSKFGRRICRLTVFIIFISALGAACNRSGAKTTDQANANANAARDEVITVTEGRATARSIPSYIQATGSLLADETSQVAAQVTGAVVSTPVDVGAVVRKGDVLARLDDRDARLRLIQTQSAVKQAEAGVRQAQARLGLGSSGSFEATAIPEVRAANANYEQTLAQLRQAEANEKRYRELVETGDVATITYEQYRTARDTAQAQVNAARQQLEAARNTARQSNESVKVAQAAVDSARSQIEIAQKAVSDTIIRAPYAGFISSRPIAVGEFVSTSTPIVTLLRTNPLKMQIQVTETQVPFITLGMSVSVEVEAFNDRKFAGTVTAINPSVDAASRTAIVEAQIENNDNLLRSGMFATAHIVRQGGGQGVFVPKSAVYSDQNTQSYRAFVIENGVAKLRVVQIGQEENDDIQILSGLNPDETVTTSNLAQLYEGAKVQIGQ